MDIKPIEVRVCKPRTAEGHRTYAAPGALITAVYAGVDNVVKHQTTLNWRDYLARKGWLQVPRVWE